MKTPHPLSTACLAFLATTIFFLVADLAAQADEDCFIWSQGRRPAAISLGEVTGDVSDPKLNSRIPALLKRIAADNKVGIEVTSGYRTAQEQADAMFNNWESLKRGKCYGPKTLSEDERKSLDDLWTIATGAGKEAKAKAAKKAEFLQLAKNTAGKRSAHVKGLAVDVRANLSDQVKKAILKDFGEVKEGNRTDIWHFYLK